MRAGLNGGDEDHIYDLLDEMCWYQITKLHDILHKQVERGEEAWNEERKELEEV